MKGYKRGTDSPTGIMKKGNTDSTQSGFQKMGRSLLGQGDGKASRARGETSLGKGGKWACMRERVNEIRGLDWVGKSREVQATGVGFVPWLWPGRGAGWRSGHKKEMGGVLLQPGSCEETVKVQGRELRGVMGPLQILWFDMNFSAKWDEFTLNMQQRGLTSKTSCQTQRASYS